MSLTSSILRRLLPLVMAARRLYWWVARPITRGVRAIVITRDGGFVLVRHTYDPFWHLPGGAVYRSEQPEAALRRELQEELHLNDVGEVVLMGVYTSTAEYKRDEISVFEVRASEHTPVSNLEISTSQAFAADALPAEVSPATRRRVLEYLGHQPQSERW